MTTPRLAGRNRKRLRFWPGYSFLMAVLGGALGCSGSDPPPVIVTQGVSPTPSSGLPSSGGSSAAPPSTDISSGTGGGGQVAPSDGGPAAHTGGGVAPDAGGGTTAATGVPCDVATMLASNCNGCHSDPPITGALAGLVTYADLMAPSQEMPNENEAQLSLARMKNSSSPMPPGALPPASDVTMLQNWINAGYPMGSCGGGGGGGGADAGAGGADGGAVSPPISSSSVFAKAAPYSMGQPVGGKHNAGQDCMSGCHNHGFTFSGTLYDSNGAGIGGAEVRLVDANGKAISVYTAVGGAQGNFYSSQSFAGPAHIGVRDATNTKDMLTPIQTMSQPPASTGGACGACHCTGGGCTVARIHLP